MSDKTREELVGRVEMWWCPECCAPVEAAPCPECWSAEVEVIRADGTRDPVLELDWPESAWEQATDG